MRVTAADKRFHALCNVRDKAFDNVSLAGWHAVRTREMQEGALEQFITAYVETQAAVTKAYNAMKKPAAASKQRGKRKTRKAAK